MVRFKTKHMQLTNKIKRAGSMGYILFCLEFHSNLVSYLFVARLPVILADLPPVTQLTGSFSSRFARHLSREPSDGEGARSAAVFERIRNAMPGGRGSVKEWVSCIWCFSLSYCKRARLPDSVDWGYGWAGSIGFCIWLSFSSISLLVNKACG